jgi:hypothetical protein
MWGGGQARVTAGGIRTVGIDGTAAECVQQFEALYSENAAYHAAVRLHLRGKGLLCWCALGTPCHGDVLLRWANRPA